MFERKSKMIVLTCQHYLQIILDFEIPELNYKKLSN